MNSVSTIEIVEQALVGDQEFDMTDFSDEIDYTMTNENGGSGNGYC
ncbi:hypothetical protein [Streptomyces sp. IB201691-2A2]|nr:hypothetical protein [Streptomyces sp. IB201691-2A2]